MRIRNICPGFWKNEELAALPDGYRLLFIGLWCVADGAGRLEDRPTRIGAELFPYEPQRDIEAGLAALADSGFIVRYDVDELKLIWIIKFSEYQALSGNERKRPSKLPPYPIQNNGKSGKGTTESGKGMTSRDSVGKEHDSKKDQQNGQSGKGMTESEKGMTSHADVGRRTEDVGHGTEDGGVGATAPTASEQEGKEKKTEDGGQTTEDGRRSTAKESRHGQWYQDFREAHPNCEGVPEIGFMALVKMYEEDADVGESITAFKRQMAGALHLNAPLRELEKYLRASGRKILEKKGAAAVQVYKGPEE